MTDGFVDTGLAPDEDELEFDCECGDPHCFGNCDDYDDDYEDWDDEDDYDNDEEEWDDDWEDEEDDF